MGTGVGGGGGGAGVGGRGLRWKGDYIYLMQRCHHQTDSSLRWAPLFNRFTNSNRRGQKAPDCVQSFPSLLAR